jgi:hypothetical protein
VPIWAGMLESDSLLSKLMPGLLVAAAVFAAWWLFIRPHHQAPVTQQGPGVLDTPSSARPYLLQASQVGPEYDQLADATRSTTSTGIRKDEPAAGLAVIRSSWKGGARAGWYQVHGSMTVSSRAELFTTSALQPVAATIRGELIRLYHGHRASPPSQVPGTNGWFLTGTTVSPIISPFDPHRRVAVYGWQHGDVLAVIVVTGLARDDVPSAAVKLARAQDSNIRFVSGS